MPAPETRDGDLERGHVWRRIEGEEGRHAGVGGPGGTAAALARPDEIVELAGFGAFGRLSGRLGGCEGGAAGGAGDGAFELGDVFAGGADGGEEGAEAGELSGVGLEFGGWGVVLVVVDVWVGGRGRGGRGEGGVIGENVFEGLNGGFAEVEGWVVFGVGIGCEMRAWGRGGEGGFGGIEDGFESRSGEWAAGVPQGGDVVGFGAEFLDEVGGGELAHFVAFEDEVFVVFEVWSGHGRTTASRWKGGVNPGARDEGGFEVFVGHG